MASTPVSQTANLYSLHNNVIEGGEFALSVSYTTSGIDGKPHFSYQDAHQTLEFAGDQINIVQSDIGMVASVTTRLVADLESTTFSLVVPTVRLGQFAQTHITTLGITTVHRTAFAPQLLLGQLEIYRVSRLEGTAAFVEFLAR